MLRDEYEGLDLDRELTQRTLHLQPSRSAAGSRSSGRKAQGEIVDECD